MADAAAAAAAAEPAASTPPPPSEPPSEPACAELTTFQCRECYVYALPGGISTASGHRAELWGLDKWLEIVSCRVVQAGDACHVRLEDLATSAAYASCPLPPAGTPLSAAVEPVVDSGRYFVIRIVDASGPKERHCFIGIGFPQRTQAYDFVAATQDHMRGLKRQAEAAKMAAAYKAAQEAGVSPLSDLSLKAGQTLTIALGKPGSFRREVAAGAPAEGAAGGGGGAPVPPLAPPPPARLPPPPPLPPPPGASAPAALAAAAAAPVAAGAAEDDGFGDFVG